MNTQQNRLHITIVISTQIKQMLKKIIMTVNIQLIDMLLYYLMFIYYNLVHIIHYRIQIILIKYFTLNILFYISFYFLE